MNIKKEILKTYNHIAKDYDKEFSQEIYFLDELNFFLKQLPKKAEILDTGCGSGHIASHLEKQGLKVTGIDFSDKMIELAKNRCKKSKFIKADIDNFDYGKEKYNGIIASFILIHLKKTSTKKLMNRIYNSMKQNGILFISTIKGKGEHFGPEPLNPEYNMYFRYTEKNEMKMLLSKTGFKIIRFKEIQRKTEHMKYTGLFFVAKKT